jgi:hypothetical protein
MFLVENQLSKTPACSRRSSNVLVLLSRILQYYWKPNSGYSNVHYLKRSLSGCRNSLLCYRNLLCDTETASTLPTNVPFGSSETLNSPQVIQYRARSYPLQHSYATQHHSIQSLERLPKCQKRNYLQQFDKTCQEYLLRYVDAVYLL